MGQLENKYSELKHQKVGLVNAKEKTLKLYLLYPKSGELIMNKLKLFEENSGGLHSLLWHKMEMICD